MGHHRHELTLEAHQLGKTRYVDRDRTYAHHFAARITLWGCEDFVGADLVGETELEHSFGRFP